MTIAMKPLSYEKLLHAAVRAGFVVDKFEDGSVRIRPQDARMLITQKASSSASRGACLQLLSAHELDMYVVGREKRPPLRNTTKRANNSTGTLARYRCARLTRPSDLLTLLTSLPILGTSTENDVYIFDVSGTLLLYLSHHEEILVYVRLTNSIRGAPVASTVERSGRIKGDRNR